MKKNQFKLTILKSPIKTYNIQSFDIETYGKHNKFFLGGYHDNRYHSFMNPKEMIKYMNEHTTKDTLIYATNLQFDYLALFNERKQLRESDIKSKGTLFFKCRYENMTFADTYAIIPSSLEALGKTIGIPKLAKPSFLGRKTKNKYELNRLKRYNAQDCLVTLEFMKQFQKALNDLGGELKFTIASCSMDLYRRKYMPHDFSKEFIQEFDDGTNVQDFIRLAYYGGRVECFMRGSDKGLPKQNKNEKRIFRMYDINNLYGLCMTKDFPVPSSARINNYPRIEFINNYHGVSEVTIECPEMYYPLLPYRSNKLIFPCGIFKGCYNHIELRKALELGYKIHKIHKQIYYTETFKPFKKYVEELYELRLKYKKDNNFIYSEVCKYLANSLYGKFGMSKQQSFEYRDIDSDDIEGAVLNNDGVGFKIFESDANQSYVMPILASTVTSYGRLELYKYITKLKALYCDTDSCITDLEIPSSNKFGDMKLEKSFTQFELVKPKLYSVKDIDRNYYYVKTKGIKLASDDVIRHKQFLKILNKGLISQQRFSKFRESIRRNIPFNTKYTIFKKTDLEDDKRDWFGKKFNRNELQDSRPIKLNMP